MEELAVCLGVVVLIIILAVAYYLITRPRNVKLLIAALENSDADVRRGAAEALGKVGGARAVEPLVAALRDDNWRVRRSVAEALGKVGNARAVESLIAALKDDDSDVRQAATKALGKVGDARAVEPLIAALRGGNQGVRRSVAEALGKIGDARAVEPLIAALADHKDIRQAAARAIVSIYRAGQIDEKHKQLILATRDRIRQPHSDKHVDQHSCSGSENYHSDTGIGINFPL